MNQIETAPRARRKLVETGGQTTRRAVAVPLLVLAAGRLRHAAAGPGPRRRLPGLGRRRQGIPGPARRDRRQRPGPCPPLRDLGDLQPAGHPGPRLQFLHEPHPDRSGREAAGHQQRPGRFQGVLRQLRHRSRRGRLQAGPAQHRRQPGRDHGQRRNAAHQDHRARRRLPRTHHGCPGPDRQGSLPGTVRPAARRRRAHPVRRRRRPPRRGGRDRRPPSSSNPSRARPVSGPCPPAT